MSKPERTSRTHGPTRVVVGIALLVAAFFVLSAQVLPLICERFTLDSENGTTVCRRGADAHASRHEQFMDECEPAVQDAREAWLEAGVEVSRAAVLEQKMRLWSSVYLYERCLVRGSGVPDTDFAVDMIRLHAGMFPAATPADEADATAFWKRFEVSQQYRSDAEGVPPVDLGVVAGLHPPPDLAKVAANDDAQVTRLATWIRVNWPHEIGYKVSARLGTLRPNGAPVVLYAQLEAGYAGSVGVVLPRRAVLGETVLHLNGGYDVALVRGGYEHRAQRLLELKEGDFVVVEVILRARATRGSGPWLEVVDGQLELLGLRADSRVVDF